MGVRWLNRQCSVVLYEFATAADENPDVIGWAPGAGSVLIECKLSRSDFLRDGTKSVRSNPRAGMGHRRYYLCPPDLIQLKDLPPKWGLLWTAKGEVIVKREARGIQRETLRPRFGSSVRCSGAHKYESVPAPSRNGSEGRIASKQNVASLPPEIG